MTYTINNKQYIEHQINERCAEIMGIPTRICGGVICVLEATGCSLAKTPTREYNPCHNPSDAWLIIEKVFDRLNDFASSESRTRWERLAREHNCDKLKAVCICLIESNGS